MPALLNQNQPFALFDNSKHGSAVLLTNLVELVRVDNPEHISQALARIDAAAGKGLYPAGYFGYELGYHLVDRQRLARLHRAATAPLLEFGIFTQYQQLDSQQLKAFLLANQGDSRPALYNQRNEIGYAQYRQALLAIKHYIRAGDTYQVNFTFGCTFGLNGRPFDCYLAIRHHQQVEYGAFINLGERQLLSFSPELFVRKQGDRLVARPMKGTSARGIHQQQDKQLARQLRQDPKSQSENVMIVDLIRNDLGRIARLGSVQVDELFGVEYYQTLLQMTSTISCQINPKLSLEALLRGLFPCGSITGAPKQRTMEIIHQLERSPRGIYTGAIGYCMPNGDLCLNVAIRTIELHRGSASMGLGSGIVDASNPRHEYRECLLKANFLRRVNQDFYLIETIRYDGQHCLRLEQHLARLKASCRFFGFPFVRWRILRNLARALSGTTICSKVRLKLQHNGAVQVSMTKLDELPTHMRLGLAKQQVDQHCCFQQHKTSRRELYNQQLAPGLYDLAFCNRSGEVAEAARHNIFVRLDNVLCTPPLSSGALGGVMRATIMSGQQVLQRPLSPQDLRRAQAVYLSNSVRGLVQVQFCG